MIDNIQIEDHRSQHLENVTNETEKNKKKSTSGATEKTPVTKLKIKNTAKQTTLKKNKKLNLKSLGTLPVIDEKESDLDKTARISKSKTPLMPGQKSPTREEIKTPLNKRKRKLYSEKDNSLMQRTVMDKNILPPEPITLKKATARQLRNRKSKVVSPKTEIANNEDDRVFKEKKVGLRKNANSDEPKKTKRSLNKPKLDSKSKVIANHEQIFVRLTRSKSKQQMDENILPPEPITLKKATARQLRNRKSKVVSPKTEIANNEDDRVFKEKKVGLRKNANSDEPKKTKRSLNKPKLDSKSKVIANHEQIFVRLTRSKSKQKMDKNILPPKSITHLVDERMKKATDEEFNTSLTIESLEENLNIELEPVYKRPRMEFVPHDKECEIVSAPMSTKTKKEEKQQKADTKNASCCVEVQPAGSSFTEWLRRMERRAVINRVSEQFYEDPSGYVLESHIEEWFRKNECCAQSNRERFAANDVLSGVLEKLDTTLSEMHVDAHNKQIHLLAQIESDLEREMDQKNKNFAEQLDGISKVQGDHFVDNFQTMARDIFRESEMMKRGLVKRLKEQLKAATTATDEND